MNQQLPPPVDAYFAAANVHNAERVAACFAEDAVVRDEGKERAGRDAIRAWADETGRKYRHTAEVVSFDGSPDRASVTARVTGHFPGSPIQLRFEFRLANEEISRLEIG